MVCAPPFAIQANAQAEMGAALYEAKTARFIPNFNCAGVHDRVLSVMYRCFVGKKSLVGLSVERLRAPGPIEANQIAPAVP